MAELIDRLNDELAGLAGIGQRSLVQVADGHRGVGAGTILHAGGLIVSNAHVVRQRDPQVTLWDGRTFSGRLLARDEQRDLAAIAISAEELPALPLGDGKRLCAGQWVVALGHPWGVKGVATAGMVIAVGRPPDGIPYQGDLIQVGLHLRPGHSGGPMLDGSGRLVGVNTMIAGPQVGLAIPIHSVKRFLKETLGSGARKRRAVPQSPAALL